MFYREAKSLQQGGHDVFLEEAGGVQKSVVGVPEVLGRSLTLIIENSKRNEPAGPRPSSAHSSYCERRQCRTRAVSGSGDTPRSSAPALLDAKDPRDNFGSCLLLYPGLW